MLEYVTEYVKIYYFLQGSMKFLSTRGLNVLL